MPIKHRACQRPVLASPRLQSNSGVWITDDVLDRSFNRFLRFSQSSKRYGSNVPGPLEAQRRLAKRKMMALAAPNSGYSPEPTILFGARGPRTKDIQWQAPGRDAGNRDNVNKGWLQAILWPKPRRGRETSTPPVQPPRGFAMSPADGEARNRPIEERLETASMEELLQYIEAVDNRRAAVKFSRQAFRRLIDLSVVPVDRVMNFLLQSKLNIPEAKNLTYFVNRCLLSDSRQERESIGRILGECCMLGVVGDGELADIIEMVTSAADAEGQRKLRERRLKPTTPTGLSPSPTVALEHDIINDVLSRVWRGVKACRIKAIPPSIARLMLKCIIRKKISTGVAQELLMYNYPTENPPPTETTLECWLAYWTQRLHDSTTAHTINYPNLNSALQALFPSVLTAAVVAKATEIIHTEISIKSPSIVYKESVLNGWLGSLRDSLPETLWYPALDYLAACGLSPRDLKGFISATPAIEIPDLLLRFWLCRSPLSLETMQLRALSLSNVDSAEYYSMTRGDNSYAWTIVSKKYHHIRKAFSRSAAHGADCFAWLLVSIYYQGHLSIDNQSIIFDVVEDLFGVRRLAEICENAREAGVFLHTRPAIDVIRRTMADQPLIALAMFKARKIYLSQVPELPVAIIRAGKKEIDVFKMLRDDDDPVFYIPENKRTNWRLAITQRKIDLIHDCADAFSRVTTGSLRANFRNVQVCYYILRHRAAPLSPVLSRALVRSGITNYLKLGMTVSRVQVAWILDLVEKIEGPLVAEHLEFAVEQRLLEVYEKHNSLGIPSRRADGRGCESIRNRHTGIKKGWGFKNSYRKSGNDIPVLRKPDSSGSTRIRYIPLKHVLRRRLLPNVEQTHEPLEWSDEAAELNEKQLRTLEPISVANRHNTAINFLEWTVASEAEQRPFEPL